MSDIKVIEGLEPWEVMKRASEGEPVVYRPYDGLGVWEAARAPHWDWRMREYAIIDTDIPEFDWDKFNWDFFNRDGFEGLLISAVDEKGAEYVHAVIEAPSYHDWEMPKPAESPFYYWAGGEQPLPDNVEVEVVLRDGKSREYPLTTKAAKFDWVTHTGHMADIVAFKLTGRVL